MSLRKTVFGTVLNTLGKRIEGVKVQVTDSIAYTDKDGRWELVIDGDGIAKEFEFWHRDYFPSRITGTIAGAFRVYDFGKVELRPLPIGGGKGKVLVEEVVIDQFGRPVRNAQLDIEKVENEQRNIVAQLFTGNKGNFSTMLDPGQYNILIYKYAYNHNAPKVFNLIVDDHSGQIR